VKRYFASPASAILKALSRRKSLHLSAAAGNHLVQDTKSKLFPMDRARAVV
jgi:hypothetical protein